jgi:hypothetical protein
MEIVILSGVVRAPRELRSRMDLLLVRDAETHALSLRYLVTTTLLNAKRGSEQYQSMKSRMAWS